MPGPILLWGITQFIATVIGSVILIQTGGWLPILTAILLLLFYVIYGANLLILAGAYEAIKKELKQLKEENK